MIFIFLVVGGGGVAGNGGRRWLEVAGGGIRIKMVIKYLKINVW